MIVNEVKLTDFDINNKARFSILTITLFLLATFLNQSYIVYGINISFADIFCVMALLLILNKLVISIKHLIFFVILSISVAFSAVFIVPILFSYSPEISSVFSNYLKLLVTFFYFIIGYNLTKLGLIDKLLKWYSIFAFLCAIIGIVWSILKINFLTDILYFGGTRYRGFMNDPNYFAIIQITGLACLSRLVKNINYKLIIWLVFVLSIIASGSKTGMVTLIVYVSIRFVEYLASIKINLKKNLFKLYLLIIILMIIIPIFMLNYQTIFYKLSNTFPSFSRIEYVFTDFSSALTDNQSGRGITWSNAINIISLSPILGIGIGTYTGLANTLFGTPVIAHNTYLQLAAEWGLPLALIFFIYTFSILGICYFRQKVNTINTVCILRDMLFILLIGSLAISLNNARMFWLFLGALAYAVFEKSRK